MEVSWSLVIFNMSHVQSKSYRCTQVYIQVHGDMEYNFANFYSLESI